MKFKIHIMELPSVALHTLVCGAIYLGILFFQFTFPVAYNYFTSEDRWIECATFVFYFIAGLLILRMITITPAVRRPGYVLLCLGLFFVAMEEISWGQRFFNLHTPQILAQNNLQAELTLHNASFFPAEKLLFYVIIIWAVFLPVILHRLKALDALLKSIGIPLVPFEIQSYFVLGFLFKNVALVIRSEEIGECLIGLGFLLFSIDIYCQMGNKTVNKYLGKGRCFGLVAIIAVAITSIIVLAGPKDIYALKRQLHKSAIMEYPQRGMNAQAEEIFKYIAQHKEFKNDDSLFQYGLFLKNIKGRQDAKAIFLTALEEVKERMLINPDKPAPNILAGKILKELNRPDLAQAEFIEALRKDQIRLAQAQLNWQKMDALKSMGETYIEIGNYSLAKEHLQRAFEFAEDGWAKTRIINMLKVMPSNSNL